MLDYDTWIEAMVRLNDTYIGSKPYNVSRFLQMKVHKMHNIDQVRGGGLTGGTGLIPWPIAAAHVRDLWRKGGK